MCGAFKPFKFPGKFVDKRRLLRQNNLRRRRIDLVSPGERCCEPAEHANAADASVAGSVLEQAGSVLEQAGSSTFKSST